MATVLTGRIIHSGDPGWAAAIQGFAARVDYAGNAPRVVVFAQNKHDVANALKWVREQDVPFRVRAGRHNYQGYSSLVPGGLILDVSEMASVECDSQTATAKVGAGIDMLNLSESLSESGLCLPLATGPTVGLGGLVQGGGFGITSRRFGLMCDNLVSAELVNAEGEFVTADAHHNSDLFWAIRGGGGGNFGVATSFEFATHAVEMVGVFNINWAWSDFEAVVAGFQNWIIAAPEAVTALLTLHVDGTVRVEGQFTPEPQDLPTFAQAIAPILAIGTPIQVQALVVPLLVGSRMIFGVDPTNPEWAIQLHDDDQLFKSTSAIAADPIPLEGILVMKNYLENYPRLGVPPSQPSMIQLLGGGGTATNVPPETTAVYWRKAACVVQYDGYWTAPADAQPTIDWVVAMRQAMLPWAKGAYVNYQDDQLGPDWLEQYYGGNLDRLRKVKKEVDPGNFFNFQQSIPPAP